MKTRAKFNVTSITHHGYGGCSVVLNAVHSSDINTEDHRFQKATPSGELKMTLSHDSGFFVPGKVFYLDFTEAE